MIALMSIHRNNTDRLPTYFKRVSALRGAVMATGQPFSLIAVEGDSTDNTRHDLIRHARRHRIDLTLVDHNHGEAHYGSVEHPTRLRALSGVLNAGFDAIPPTATAVIYVESDLLWHASTLMRLLATQRESGFDVLSPLVMAGAHFYDVWGYRDLDGNRFSPFTPYHHALNGCPMEVSSVGSCFVASAAVASQCRVRDDYALVGWCRDVRAHGYRIAVDPILTVRHPA